MRDIFLISDKQENFSIFYSHLGHLPIHFSWGGGIDQALESLPQENPSFIFLIADNPDFLDDWIDRISQREITTPIVVFTKHIGQAKREALWEKGITELIQLPKHYKEFEYIIKAIIRDGSGEVAETDNQLQGHLQDFSLVELIQTFSDAGKNGILTILKGNRQGTIHFNKGRVVNASLKSREPLEAILTMATWFTGKFHMQQDRTLHREKISMDSLQIISRCQEEIRKRNNMMRLLPNLSSKFFVPPDLNYEEVEPTERGFLIKFKNGAPLKLIIDMYGGHTLHLLQRIKKWIDQGMLIDPDSYDRKMNALKEAENMSGIRKMFSKMFTKSTPEKTSVAAGSMASISMEEEAAMAVKKKKHDFKDLQRLDDFIRELEANI